MTQTPKWTKDMPVVVYRADGMVERFTMITEVEDRFVVTSDNHQFDASNGKRVLDWLFGGLPIYGAQTIRPATSVQWTVGMKVIGRSVSDDVYIGTFEVTGISERGKLLTTHFPFDSHTGLSSGGVFHYRPATAAEIAHHALLGKVRERLGRMTAEELRIVAGMMGLGSDIDGEKGERDE